MPTRSSKGSSTVTSRMHARPLGRGTSVSEVGSALGVWVARTREPWPTVQPTALRRAHDLGVTFFDTSDLYGRRHSTRVVRRISVRRICARRWRAWQARGERQALSAAQFALRFCLLQPAVSTVIPGMLTCAHVEENIAASAFGPLDERELETIAKPYAGQSFFLNQ